MTQAALDAVLWGEEMTDSGACERWWWYGCRHEGRAVEASKRD
jgi:hypothetical protein